MKIMEQAYMTSKIIIFALEPLDNRYTKQWFTEIPTQLEATGAEVMTVIGDQRSSTTTAGAFLDFADTNHWKSSQLCDFVLALEQGQVPDDATLLFTDFWNPALIQVAYMRDLLGKQWKIHGIAHAGAYDPSDILGLKMRPEWPKHFERSLFYASDVTYFASEFHRSMFLNNLEIPFAYHDRAVLSGQPHSAIVAHMSSIKEPENKSRQVIWPHRYNEDKQPEIAEELANDFDMVITQKLNLSKDEFYRTMADTKVLFSCALHENLGISVMEGVLIGAIPLLPDRCSYAEMYLPEFKYPSVWTESYENFITYRPQLVNRLNSILDDPTAYAELMQRQKDILISNYLSADVMIDRLTGSSQ
jgi:hypothetical protein